MEVSQHRYFEVQVTEILNDPRGRLTIGDTELVEVFPLSPGHVDSSINVGDKVEVHGSDASYETVIDQSDHYIREASPTTLTLNLDPPSIAEMANATVVINGRLARDDGAGMANVRVDIWAAKGLSGVSVYTDGDGYYRYEWTNINLPNATGYAVLAHARTEDGYPIGEQVLTYLKVTRELTLTFTPTRKPTPTLTSPPTATWTPTPTPTATATPSLTPYPEGEVADDRTIAVLEEKKRSIEVMSDLDIEWLGLSVSGPSRVNLGYDESGISALVAQYEATGFNNSEEASRFYRLVLTEQAVYELYRQAVTTSDTGGEALSKLLWLIVTFPSLLTGELLVNVEIKGFSKVLPEGLRQDILYRFCTAAARFVNLIIDSTNASPAIRASLRVLVNGLFSDLTHLDLFVGEIVQVTLRLAIDEHMAELFIEETQDTLDDGLSAATSSSMPLQGTDDESAAQLEQTITEKEEQSHQVVSDAREKIFQAGVANLISDVLNLADAVVPSSPWKIITVGGKIIAKLFAGFQLARALSAVYGDFDDSVQLALQVDDLAFDPDRLLALDRDVVVMPSDQLASLSVFGSIAPDPATVAYFTAIQSKLTVNEATFEQELVEMVALVQAGDAEGAYKRLDSLSGASMELLSTFETATAPIHAVSGEATEQVTGFQDTYLDMFADAQMYDAESLILYGDLLHFLESPDAPQLRAQVESQANVVLGAIDDYRDSFETTSQLVQTLPLPAVAIITDHTVEGTIAKNRAVQVTFHILNASSTAANQLQLEIVPSGPVQLISPEAQSLGPLPSGEEMEATVEVQIISTEVSPLIIGNLTTDGYVAPMYFVVLSPALSVSDGGEGGGFGVVILLLVLIVGGVVTVVVGRRRRISQLRALAAVPDKARTQLQGLSGAWVGRSITITTSELTIGRGSGCDLRLPDRAVSRRHAIIRYARGRYFLQDQGSRHGTFVNGRRVEATALSDGDIIRIGGVEMQFRVGRQG